MKKAMNLLLCSETQVCFLEKINSENGFLKFTAKFVPLLFLFTITLQTQQFSRLLAVDEKSNLLMVDNRMTSANSVVIKYTMFVALLFCL